MCAQALHPARPAALPASLFALTEQLRRCLKTGDLHMSDHTPAPVPAEHYASDERHAAEQRSVFRQYPLIVGHVDQVADTGDVLSLEPLGLPLIVARDADGQLRCFVNSCRHRGMQLIGEPRKCGLRSLVCPYHGWTYRLNGELKHVPHAEAFPDLNMDESGLVELPCASRFGLVWIIPEPGARLDLDDYLGSLGEDFEFLGLNDAVLYKQTLTPRAANWKLIIDAFLEAYHVRVLHRNSIYPFFEDALAVSEAVDPHLRSAVARRGLAEVEQLPEDPRQLRDLVSYTHFVFPNTIVVYHPDYASVLSFFPDGPDKLRWMHNMLVPAQRNGPELDAHWQKSLLLIEKTVFDAEDLAAAQSIQRGLQGGYIEHIQLGRLEYMIRYFHDRVQDAIDRYPAAAQSSS